MDKNALSKHDIRGPCEDADWMGYQMLMREKIIFTAGRVRYSAI